MDARSLERLGLTGGEAKVYWALLSLGATKTGLLASKAGVSSSKVYKILDRLEKKGLAGHVFKGGTKFFRAMPPRRMRDYLDERQAELERERGLFEELLPELEKQEKTAGQIGEAAVLEGFKAVTNWFRNMIDEMQAGEAYHVIGANYGTTPALRQFFLKHHKRRARKRIQLKMLANHDVKGKLVESTLLNAEIRYLPQYLISNMQIGFYRNKALIAIWVSEPKGFMIENEEAVKTFTSYFNAFWKLATK